MRLNILLYLFLVFFGGSILFRTSSGIEYKGLLKDSVITPVSDSLDLTQGKKLYETKCRKCHQLYKPKEYKLRQWKDNLDEMKNKAELDENDYKLIFAYLKENCKK